MKMHACSYSIGYTQFGTASPVGLIDALQGTPTLRQVAYNNATLSPEPVPLLPALHPPAVPQFGDDFFATAFEGIVETVALDADPGGDPVFGPLKGYLEDCRPNRIAGWAQNTRPGSPPVHVAIMLGRIALAELVADQWRVDLSVASIGSGFHAFEFQPVPPIASDLLGAVKVIRMSDKAELPRVFKLINQ